MIDTYGFYAFSKRKNKDHTHIELEEQKVPMLRKTVSCDDSKMIYQNDITKNGNNHFHVAETEVVSTLDLFLLKTSKLSGKVLHYLSYYLSKLFAALQ